MTRFRICIVALLFGLLAFAGQVHADPHSYSLPKASELEGDHAKLVNLFFARQYIHSLISQSAEFNLNPLRILEGEEELLHTLEKNPEYEAIAAQPREYLEVVITDPETRSRKVKFQTVLPEKQHALFESLKTLFSDLAKKPDAQQEIVRRVRETAGYLRGRSPKDVSSGLVKLMDRDKQGAAFKEPNPEVRLKMLESISDRPIPPELARVNHWPESYRVADAIQEVRKMKTAEDELGRLTLAWSVLERNDGNLEMPSLETINHILDPEELRKPLASLTQAVEDGAFRIFTKDQQNWVASAVGPYASIHEKTIDDALSLTLLEVPPEVAAYRGCAARNCQSQKEFAITNDPHERTLYVYNTKNHEIMGTVEGTHLHGDGREAFYINTLGGRMMGPKEISLVLDGFKDPSLVKRLGVSEVLLPEPHRYPKMFNGKQTQDAVLAAVDVTQEKRELAYKNVGLRRIIETFEHKNNFAKYDWMDQNEFGVPIKTETTGKPLKVEIKAAVLPEKIMPALTREDAIGIALDLHFADMDDVLSRFAPSLSLDLNELRPLFAAVGNSKKEPAEQYLETAKKAIRDAGLPESMLSERKSLIRRGWLQAPDAMSEIHRETTIGYFAKELYGPAAFKDVVKFSKKYWHELIASPVVAKSVRNSVESGSYEDLMKLRKLLPDQSGMLPDSLKGALLTRARDPDVRAYAISLFPSLSSAPGPETDEMIDLMVKTLWDPPDVHAAVETAGAIKSFEPKTPLMIEEIKRAAGDPKLPIEARRTLLSVLAQIAPTACKVVLLDTISRSKMGDAERLLFSQATLTFRDPDVAKKAVEYFRDESRNPDDKIRKLLLQTLGVQLDAHPENSEIKDAFLSAAKDPHPGIRRQFVLLASQKGGNDPEWFDHAFALAQDPDAEVRKTLAKGLSEMSKKNPKANELLHSMTGSCRFESASDALKHLLSQ